MYSFLISIIAIVIVGIIQYMLSRSDSIIYGLLFPALLTLFAVAMSYLTAGNALNKFNAFLEWFIPAIAGLVIYFYAKRAKYRKRKAEKLAEKERLKAEKEAAKLSEVEPESKI